MLFIKTGNVPDPDNSKALPFEEHEHRSESCAEHLDEEGNRIPGKGLNDGRRCGRGDAFQAKERHLGWLSIDIAKDLLMERLKELEKQDILSRYDIDESSIFGVQGPKHISKDHESLIECIFR